MLAQLDNPAATRLSPPPPQVLEPVSPVKLSAYHDFESIAHLQPRWDHSVEQLNSTVYMTFDWLRNWWRTYRGDDRLCILVFEHGTQLVGLLPVYISALGIGPLRCRVARLVGANVPPKTFDPPISAPDASEIFAAAFKHLFQVEKCDLLSFGPVSRQWTSFASFQQSAAELARSGHSVASRVVEVRTLFSLPDSFDQYLDQMEPSERKSRLKRIRQLEKNFRITEDIITDPGRVLDEFDRFAALHAQQWALAGKGGHFTAWPKALDFNRALVADQARHGRVAFYRLLADDEVIASRYTFRLGGTLFSELPARASGKWDKFGIGVTSLIKFTGAAIGNGIKQIDSGLGAYEHKTGVGGEEVPVLAWRITSNQPLARWRSQLLRLAAKAIVFTARKIWYRRILPRMPSSFVRSQSLWWLRYDF